MKPWLLPLVLMLGCDDFGALERLKPRRVPVTLVDTYHLLDGGTEVVVPAGVTVDAWVDVEGSWQHVEGSCDGGRCELRDVPPGVVLLHRSDRSLFAEVDDSPSYELGVEVRGRPIGLANTGTRVTAVIAGGAPLGARTWLQARVPDVPLLIQNRNPAVPGFELRMPSGALGATSFSYTFGWAGLPLLRREPLELYQAEPVTSAAGVTRWELKKTGAAADVSVVDGRDVQVGFTLNDVASGAAVSGTSYDFTRLVNAALEDPKVSVLGVMASLDVEPEGDPASISVAAELRTAAPWSLSVAAPTVDPFPGRAKKASHAFLVRYQYQIGRSSSHVALSALHVGPADSTGWHDTTALGPPRSLAMSPVDGDGRLTTLTPTLTWTPPTFGTPNRYFVIILDSSLNEVPLPQLYVLLRPRLHVPPDVLKPDTLYSFWVIATNCDVAPLHAPLHELPQLTCGAAEAATGAYRTPR